MGVALDVFASEPPELLAVPDDGAVEARARWQPSVPVGIRTGVYGGWMIVAPSLRKTSSNAIRTGRRRRGSGTGWLAVRIVKLERQGGPGAGQVGGDAARCTRRVHLDEEQHVQPANSTVSTVVSHVTIRRSSMQECRPRLRCPVRQGRSRSLEDRPTQSTWRSWFRVRRVHRGCGISTSGSLARRMIIRPVSATVAGRPGRWGRSSGSRRDVDAKPRACRASRRRSTTGHDQRRATGQ